MKNACCISIQKIQSEEYKITRIGELKVHKLSHKLVCFLFMCLIDKMNISKVIHLAFLQVDKYSHLYVNDYSDVIRLANTH